MSTITITEAARIIGITPNGLRSIERRYDELRISVRTNEGAERRAGYGHRRYERAMVLSLKDALQEGLVGRSALERAHEIYASRRHSESPILRERMTRVERQLAKLTTEIRLLRESK